LLKAGEVRGRDASGYAWVAGDDNGLFKKDVPGSRLHVGKLPENADVFIAHTRASTHGHASNMNNNHPVESPFGTIRLVHNGVISNHNEARELLGDIGAALPEVDSSVLPAVIETMGLDGTDVLRGDATAAWLDSDTGATLHLAKFNHNPISYVWLEDGTFVFASTDGILGNALNSLGLRWMGTYPNVFATFGASDYLQILGGDIILDDSVDWDTTYRPGASAWRSVTSGHSTAQTPTTGTARPVYYTAPVTTVAVPSEDKVEDTPAGVRVVGNPDEEIWPYGDSLGEDAYDYWRVTGHLPGEDEDEPMYSVQSSVMFYTIEDDGTYNTYNSLSTLVQSMSWFAGLTEPAYPLVGPEEGNLRWVNHLSELGSISSDGFRVSWVDDDDDLDKFRSLLPSFVADGVDKLRLLKVTAD
jgi:hypothetical protein